MSCLREDMFILPSASLISRAAFEAIGGFDPRLSGYEDDDLFLRMFQAGYDGLYVDECLSQWRIHGSSSSYSARMRRSRRIYAGKLMAAFPDNPRDNLHYVSEVIVPRFVRSAVIDLNAALRAGNFSAFPEIVAELKELTPGLRQPQRLAWKITLFFLAHYWIAYGARNAVQAGRMLYVLYRMLMSPLRMMTADPLGGR
jgi:GT2 family glycosyltransferase